MSPSTRSPLRSVGEVATATLNGEPLDVSGYREEDGLALANLAAQNELRVIVDELETLVADDLWPMPKYRELLFQY